LKAKLEDLAVFGGTPAFAEPLHVGRPNVGDRQTFLARMEDLLDRRWLTNDGPLVQELETRVAETVQVDHCVAVANGTVALEILVRAAGLEGEVIVPSFTFVGTAHAMLWSGLTPRFCDVDPVTHTLDPERAEELIGERTRAILGVHLWGRPCRIDALEQVAARHGLKLFFDAAHAYGSSYRARPVGGFGDAEIFSFHATKIVNSFEGGAIVTNDRGLADRARLLRNFGFVDWDEVVALGTNGKLSEVCAAMGLTSLESLDDFVAANRRNWQRYRERLARLPGLALHAYDEHERWNHHYVVIEVDGTAALGRDELQRVLFAEGVLARRYFYPGAHRLEPYRTLDPSAGRQLPVTEALADRVLCLPTGTAIGPPEIDLVCDIVEAGFEHAGELRRRFAA
jgi:dTDP-4-amino-4,6-dideoxygalactose transaminase